MDSNQHQTQDPSSSQPRDKHPIASGLLILLCLFAYAALFFCFMLSLFDTSLTFLLSGLITVVYFWLKPVSKEPQKTGPGSFWKDKDSFSVLSEAGDHRYRYYPTYGANDLHSGNESAQIRLDVAACRARIEKDIDKLSTLLDEIIALDLGAEYTLQLFRECRKTYEEQGEEQTFFDVLERFQRKLVAENAEQKYLDEVDHLLTPQTTPR